MSLRARGLVLVIGLILVTAAPVGVSASTSDCYPAEARAAAIRVNATESSYDSSTDIRTNDTPGPMVSTDIVVYNLTQTPARKVAGPSPGLHQDLLFKCAGTPGRVHYLRSPTGQEWMTRTTLQMDLRFSNVDLAIAGTWSVLGPAYELVNTFVIVVVTSTGLTTTASEPGSVEGDSEKCSSDGRLYFLTTRSNKSIAPASDNMFAPVLNRSWSKMAVWSDECYDDSHDTPRYVDPHAYSAVVAINGPTKTSHGSHYGVAIQHVGDVYSDHSKGNEHNGYTSYWVEGVRYWIDNRSNHNFTEGTKLWANPYATSGEPDDEGWMCGCDWVWVAADAAYAYMTASMPWVLGIVSPSDLRELSEDKGEYETNMSGWRSPYTGNKGGGASLSYNWGQLDPMESVFEPVVDKYNISCTCTVGFSYAVEVLADSEWYRYSGAGAATRIGEALTFQVKPVS